VQQVVIVWGTRPEAIKLGPVAFELRRLGVEPTLVCTGQHSDLLNGTPAESDLKDSYSLGIRSEGDVKSWLNQAILRISNALPAQNAIVVVQGDTMICLVGAPEIARESGFGDDAPPGVPELWHDSRKIDLQIARNVGARASGYTDCRPDAPRAPIGPETDRETRPAERPVRSTAWVRQDDRSVTQVAGRSERFWGAF
jgi:hypothetical protein